MLLARNTSPRLAQASRNALGRRFAPTRNFSASSSNSANSFKYQVAVAYSAKERDTPLDLQKYPAGEDNFIHSVKHDGSVVVGVADGVGGWSNHEGCNSADLSHEVCRAVESFFSEGKVQGLISLLSRAYSAVVESKRVAAGGTTVCFGVLEPSKESLKVLNLGDSWCGVYRNYTLVNETKFQTLGFNTPAQLSIIPPKMLAEAEKKKTRYIHNMPEDADVYDFKIQKDDIIVFATDGVTDNVYPEDIGIFFKDQFSEGKEPSLDNVAKVLVNGVKRLAGDNNYPSPFSQEMSRVSGVSYYGGKMDDITVVLVKID